MEQLPRRELSGRPDRLCLNTATLGYREPIGTTAARAAAAGFGWITPWRREIDERQPARDAEAIRAAGLRVRSYCRTSSLAHDTAAGRRAAVDDNRRALEAAAALGASELVAVVGGLAEGSRDAEASRALIRDGLEALLPAVESTGVRIALEPLHPFYAADRSLLSTIAQAREWCEALDPGGLRLGVAVDAYHVWWDPLLAPSIAAAGPRILAFHVCDWLRHTQEPLLDRGMMGDGVADLKGIRAAVEDAGYSGPCEVEIFSAADWWLRDPDEVLDVMVERFRAVC